MGASGELKSTLFHLHGEDLVMMDTDGFVSPEESPEIGLAVWVCPECDTMVAQRLEQPAVE